MQADVEFVRSYHQRTKHRFQAYAPGPETLDWDAQPAPFRHFDGAPSVALPAFAESLHDAALRAALTRPFATISQPIQPVPCTMPALGALLHLALGITAWKSYGPDRWAVRANPSSGNLHPVEAYVLICGMQDLSNGLYHYRCEEHTLERRADFTPQADHAPSLQIALTSVMWREAWKYGERAFRYCQLDTGHTVAALRYAAAVLGWVLAEQPHVGTATLAQLLGLDRAEDFPARRHPEAEREEAEILLAVGLDGMQSAPPESLPAISAWHGTASTIDAHPMYRWPIIEQIAHATWRTDTPPSSTDVDSGGSATMSRRTSSPMTAAGAILTRRSAQRFDARHTMPGHDFIEILDALLPRPQVPWDALADIPRINLLLFVHRVEGFESGLYLLTRTKRLAPLLQTKLDARFARQPMENIPLQQLTPAPAAELHRAARSLHCHQDIASNACFALGMPAEFDSVIAENPAAYRDLHREAGLIGQVLYLEAETHGLRGTGIGCFFDDPVHELFGLEDDTFQTLYHFTVGLPLDDPRIATISTSIPTRTS